LTNFSISSKAGTATITNQAGLAGGALGGTTLFSFSAGGGNAVIVSEGATASGAGGGMTTFQDSSGAANATLSANAVRLEGAAVPFNFRIKPRAERPELRSLAMAT
jgi:hypothetical protein